MTETPQPTVFVVDDDDDVRTAVTRLFQMEDFAVKSYASATAFLEDYDPALPGCLVLDLRMPEMTGLELQEILHQRDATLPIIFVSGHSEVSAAVRGMKAGAVDFLEKPFDDDVLIGLVRDSLTRLEADEQSHAEANDIKARFGRLTPREQEVLTLVAAGHSNKEIARIMEISHRTVETHRFRLMQKMNAESVSELVSIAVVCGVHELPG